MIKLTKKEYLQIVEEIAEKMRDVMFMGSLEKNLIAQHSRREFEEWINGDFEINFSYSFSLIANDLVQMLGRIRRKNKPYLKIDYEEGKDGKGSKITNQLK